MQRISRAPELSATLSLDSCWIIALPRLLHHVDQAPALGLGERPGLDHADHVSLAGLVALVVGVQLGRAANDLLVGAVTAGDVDADRDRLVAFAGDDDPLANLGRVRLTLGRRSGPLSPPRAVCAAAETCACARWPVRLSAPREWKRAPSALGAISAAGGAPSREDRPRGSAPKPPQRPERPQLPPPPELQRQPPRPLPWVTS